MIQRLKLDEIITGDFVEFLFVTPPNFSKQRSNSLKLNWNAAEQLEVAGCPYSLVGPSFSDPIIDREDFRDSVTESRILDSC